MIGSVESSEIFHAGFFGTVVAVLFIDRVVEVHQERQRKRYGDIALRSLGMPLRRHFGFLCSMLKVSVTKEPESIPATLAGLFGPGYIEALACLDFSKPVESVSSGQTRSKTNSSSF